MRVLILPGVGDSGPEHWQTLWESTDPSFQRVGQSDWNNPVCLEWADSLERSVAAAGSQTVLVAHSLACLVVAHWADRSRHRIKGALLVAVPDPGGPAFPKEAIGFSPVPMNILAFRSIVVASTDDPYGSMAHARACAAAWGSELVDIGPAGHINASSGLARWPFGYSLLRRLIDERE